MSKRTERVSMEIQRVLSDVLLRGLPDPRVTPISITSVVCSPDLRHAKVHFVPLGGLRGSEAEAGKEAVPGRHTSRALVWLSTVACGRDQLAQVAAGRW